MTRTLGLICVFTLCAGTGTVAAAAEAAPAAAEPPITEIQDLEDILVRGKRLRDAIADAEDEFFALYNRINKDDDYSTSCVNLTLDPDSRITSRMCIPGFMADALADQVYFQQQCQSPGRDEDGNEFPPPPCYTPPPPQLVLTERGRDYANNLMKVIKTDLNLQRLAGDLDDLYYELQGVQVQYLKVKAAELKATDDANAGGSSRN